jgi:hypothetical protein
VFIRIGALLAAVIVTTLCAEPAGASLKRVVIVNRLDAGTPALVDVERGNPTERKAGEAPTEPSEEPSQTRPE